MLHILGVSHPLLYAICIVLRVLILPTLSIVLGVILKVIYVCIIHIDQFVARTMAPDSMYFGDGLLGASLVRDKMSLVDYICWTTMRQTADAHNSGTHAYADSPPLVLVQLQPPASGWVHHHHCLSLDPVQAVAQPA